MYRSRIEKDFNTWIGLGLLDPPSARAMLDEYDARESVFSAGRVLLVLAAVLLSAAILLLIASNWSAIPRLMRVVGIVALIWIFHLLAAWCLDRGYRRPAAALLILGTASFGGAIALVGQMYNLSGDAVEALLVWLAAACIAAVAFRSAAVAVMCGLLAWALFAQLVLGDRLTGQDETLLYLLPGVIAVVVTLMRYTQAGAARHLPYLLALAWLGWLYTEFPHVWMALGLVVSGSVLFLSASLPASPLHGLTREAGVSPVFYSFALACLGLGLLHLHVDGLANEVLLAALALATAVAGIALAGHMNGAVRLLGYAVFSGETLYLAFATLGTMLGTSGFFLASGLVVAAIAWLIIKLEKRLAARPQAKDA